MNPTTEELEKIAEELACIRHPVRFCGGVGMLATREGRVRVVRLRDSGGTMSVEIGRWCYRGWVRCESCEVQQRHPVGVESRADFECEHCGATLRWTDEDETPKGMKSWLWRVVE